MKIGFFTDSYLPSPDGVATSVEGAAKELQKLGHEVFIIAPNQPHEKDRKNVYRLVSVKIVKSPEVWWALEVPQRSLFKIAALEFDIIHGHSGGPISFLGRQLARLHNIPFVETYHTLWRYYRHYFIYPDLLKLWVVKKITSLIGNDWDAVITPSVKAKKELLSDGVKKTIYIVPNGIYTEKFGHHEKGFLHDSYAIPYGKKILLTIGRLNKEKSIDFLIRSFAEVYKSHLDTVLVIVGTGLEKEKLQRLAAFYHITNNVYFVGSVPYTDMPKVYTDADLFLFASQTETQGMVMIEALASSVPVIAVEDDAFVDVITNGSNGYLVKKDKDLFARKIKMVLQDNELRAKLSRNAKESAKQFDVTFTTRILDQVYKEIIFTYENTAAQYKKRKHLFLGANKNLPKEYETLKELLEHINPTILNK